MEGYLVARMCIDPNLVPEDLGKIGELSFLKKNQDDKSKKTGNEKSSGKQVTILSHEQQLFSEEAIVIFIYY